VKFTVAARGNALACTPRLGADKDGDYVWVGNSFGGTLGRIDIRIISSGSTEGRPISL
jgi:hypothetical protein